VARCEPVERIRLARFMRVLSVVGTRPNLMKTAPIVAELERRGVEQVLVHTGQHYDQAMSDVFFRDLGIRDPDHHLAVGSGTHAEQAARVMQRLEPILAAEDPDIVLVPGDVNSTLAAAIAAVKSGVPLGHIEAGLRSFDRSMPEELNRVLTDSVSDMLFVHSPEAHENLLREGLPEAAIHYVGNTMIDSLVALRDRFVDPGVRGYLLVTLHRPALVDGPLLAETVRQLQGLDMPVVFPVPPRTRAALEAQGLEAPGATEPVGYLEFLGLVEHAMAVLTDSGGIQEETTFLGIPCFTLRDNTERPITAELGTNTLLGLAPERIAELPALIARRRESQVPPYWDGTAGVRLVDALLSQAPIRRRS
jgi:UDP-N-acetylglucosamine 2-epimerase (non-hydrolysing)